MYNDSKTNAPFLDEYRSGFLDNLLDSIRSYFPEGNTKEFDVFLPSRIPNKESKIISYGVTEITSICKFYYWDELDKDCNGLLNDWTGLLRTMIDSPNFCNLRNNDTSIIAFWGQFLKANRIAWAERTKKLIHTVLVLPVGSADVERVFSVLNILLNSRRTNKLTLQHMNDIMRVRITTLIKKFPTFIFKIINTSLCIKINVFSLKVLPID